METWTDNSLRAGRFAGWPDVPPPTRPPTTDTSPGERANVTVCRSFAVVHTGRNGAGEGEEPFADPPVFPSMSDVRATLRIELAGAS
jgi:hypothetical protein